ncbi:MAG: CoA transferase [Dehalococcoidia bacterium]|nr:CoA transferase [Dehalococcoidia bacterium]
MTTRDPGAFTMIDCSTGLAGAWAAHTAAGFGCHGIRLSDGPPLRSTLPVETPADVRAAFERVLANPAGQTVLIGSAQLETTVSRLAEEFKGRFAIVEDRGGPFTSAALELANSHNGHVLTIEDPAAAPDYQGWSLPEPLLGALSGHTGQAGVLGRPPVGLPSFMSEYFAGMFGLIGLLAARYRRRDSHRHVMTSRLEALATLHPFAFLAYSRLSIVKKRGNPLFPRTTTFACTDGEVVLAVIKPRHWDALCLMTEQPGLVTDERFATPMARALRLEQLKSFLGPWFGDRSRTEVAAACIAARIPFGLVRTPEEAAQEPFSSRQFFDPGLPVRFPPAVLDNGKRTVVPGRSLHAGAPGGDAAPVRDPDAPLAGLRVVDLTTAVAGPFATRLLADLGADVLVLEPRGPEGYIEISELGDRIGAFLPNYDSTEDPLYAAGARHQAGRGKRSLVLSKPAEVQAALAQADVFFQNFAPGVAEARGFGVDALRAINPRLTYVSLSGFGQAGPYAGVPAFAPTTEAEAGFTWLTSASGKERGEDVLGLADYASALEAVCAVLARLVFNGCDEFHQVDVSQAEATMRIIAESLELGGDAQSKTFPGYGVYPALGSDEWVAVCPAGPEAESTLAKLVGAPPGADLGAHVAAWTGARTKHSAAAELQKLGVAAAPVLYANEVFADPFLNRKGLFFDLADHSGLQPTRHEGLQVRFGGWRPAYVPGPHIGESSPPWMQLRQQSVEQ